MTDPRPTNTPAALSRRALSRGAAWSVPALAVASVAPALALSLTGCATMLWTKTTLSGAQGTSGVRTGTITLASGDKVTVTVSQNRTGGSRSYDQALTYDGTNGDFSATSAGAQRAGTAGAGANKDAKYVVDPSTTSSVLTLNQQTSSSGSRASETLTFSFKDSTGALVTPETMSFNIYDITMQDKSIISSTKANQRYTDQASFANATMTTTNHGGVPATYTQTATSLTGTSQSTATGNYVDVVLTPTGSENVTLTYANANTYGPLTSSFNQQYIGIGDLEVCF